MVWGSRGDDGGWKAIGASSVSIPSCTVVANLAICLGLLGRSRGPVLSSAVESWDGQLHPASTHSSSSVALVVPLPLSNEIETPAFRDHQVHGRLQVFQSRRSTARPACAICTLYVHRSVRGGAGLERCAVVRNQFMASPSPAMRLG